MIYSRIEPPRKDIANILAGLQGSIQFVGTEAFPTRFARLMRECFGVEEFLVFQRSGAGESPEILFSYNRENRALERASEYCARFYRFDPINDVLDEAPDGSYAIRVRAEDIKDPIYRRKCYTQPGLTEKLSLVQKSDGCQIALSVFGRGREGLDFNAVQELSHFGNILLSVLSLHYRLLSGSSRHKQVSVAEMEDCVSWTFPELSKREVSVCARSILGVTAEGIALDLGIRQTSVLTYRRRAYARLNVNSINQLSTMLIQSAAARQLATAS